MFERNPLLDALKIIRSNQHIQAFLKKNQLTEKYINRYLWYTIINHSDETTCKRYLELLLKMRAEDKLTIDTMLLLLEPPQGEMRNIGEMIAETFSKIDCILLLTNLLEGLPREQFRPFMPCSYKHFRNTYTKEDLHARADSILEPQACIDYCLRAIDEDSPLGYIMYLPRGCYPCSITEGTLANFVETLAISIQAQKELEETVHIVEEVIDEITTRVNASREKKSHRSIFTSRVDSMLKLLREEEKDEEKSLFGNFKFSIR